MEKNKIALVLLRLSLGWIFFWAFIDKAFGLGFATKPGKAWLLGNSPTAGFLSNAKGYFASFFNSLANNSLVDWLFMLGLLLIGIALIFGIAMKLAAWSGSIMLFLMWLA